MHSINLLWGRDLITSAGNGMKAWIWPADLVKQCSIIFTMLVDDTAVRSVIDDIFVAQPSKGTIIVECSTIYPGSQILL